MPEALLAPPVRRESHEKSVAPPWHRTADPRSKRPAPLAEMPMTGRYEDASYPAGLVIATHGFAPSGDTEVARMVGELALQWRADTLITSSMIEMVLHPAYQRIIGLGRRAVPHVLQELQKVPGQWFWALRALTGEDPAKAAATFEGKRDAWLLWGRSRGYLSD